MKLAKTILLFLATTFSLSALAFVETTPRPAPTPFMNPIHTQIVGKFEGWQGDTIFQLANGQSWQQAEPGVLKYPATDPHVTIYGANGCIRMQLEGEPQSILCKTSCTLTSQFFANGF